jgi:hypothetical protein
MKRIRRPALLLAALLALVPPCRAGDDDYRALLRRLPDSTTAIILVDVNGLRQALGVAHGTALQTAGIAAVPGSASKFVLGAQIDLSTQRHVWSVALATTDGKLALSNVAKTENEPVQDIGGHPAVMSHRGAYFVELGSKLLAAVTPANGKMLVKWLKFQDANQLDTIPAYLISAASAGEPALMLLAVDLEDSADMATVRRGLTQSQVLSTRENVDYDAVARVIAKAKGIRLSVRAGNPLSGSLTVDFDADTGTIRDFAKPLLLDTLRNTGLYVPDFDDWRAEVTDRAVSLSGPLSVNALRKFGTLIRTPAPNPVAADPDANQAATPGARNLAASQQYFQSITRILEDLKNDPGNSLESRSGWYDHAAAQINNLPTLDVAPELIAYGSATGERMQSMSSALKTASMQIGYVRHNSIVSYLGPVYGSPQAGWTQTSKVVGAIRDQVTEARRRLWDQMEDATAKVRNLMTQRFNAQF